MSVQVRRNVLVLGAEVIDHDVVADVYGSEANLCGTVRFTVADARERAAMATQLQGWAVEETALTYVQRDGSVTLQDDQALYGGQLEPSP